MRKAMAVVAGVLLLGAVNWTIYAREQLLERGKVVLLELAPVDPRSLMQGDYMALRFKIAGQVPQAAGGKKSQDGHVVVKVDANGVGTFLRRDGGEPLAPGEARLRYRIREGQVKFATNAFFFEEGTAGVYSRARYGEFRVAPDGEMLLTRLADEKLALLGRVRSTP